MTEKIFDWKGNEIKAGMTIYFVQTRVGFPESARQGFMIPGVGQVWEPEEEWLERKNQEIWVLGEELIVEKCETGRLYVNTVTKGKGELEGYTFNSKIDLIIQSENIPDLTIAIKGISDKKD